MFIVYQEPVSCWGQKNGKNRQYPWYYDVYILVGRDYDVYILRVEREQIINK